jgi:hypothetical protein
MKIWALEITFQNVSKMDWALAAGGLFSECIFLGLNMQKGPCT